MGSEILKLTPLDHPFSAATGWDTPSLHGHCPASSLLRDSPPLPGEGRYFNREHSQPVEKIGTKGPRGNR
jgi:hypothetical protein